MLNSQVQEFIGNTTSQGKPFFGKPFFAYVAPYAPHGPATPGPGDGQTFNGLRAPRPLSFNEQDVTDKPPWIQSLRRFSSDDIANIDKRHENRIESLQAVDDLVGAVVRKLREQGVLSNTYIVFTSDNGFHHGEHRIRQGKARPYEESVRVPLVISGPGVAAKSTTDNFVLNTDYFPTFTGLAGIPTPSYVDGRSLQPVLTGTATTSNWRSAILLEAHQSKQGGETPTYSGILTSSGSKYIEYEGDVREFYNVGADPCGEPTTNLEADPCELTNIYDTSPPPGDLVTAREGVKVDWEELMPPIGIQVLPRRWVGWSGHFLGQTKTEE